MQSAVLWISSSVANKRSCTTDQLASNLDAAKPKEVWDSSFPSCAASTLVVLQNNYGYNPPCASCCVLPEMCGGSDFMCNQSVIGIESMPSWWLLSDLGRAAGVQILMPKGPHCRKLQLPALLTLRTS